MRRLCYGSWLEKRTTSPPAAACSEKIFPQGCSFPSRSRSRADMPETAIVADIRRLAARTQFNPKIVRGIGDDCAILRPATRHDLVFTTDLVLEGRHFALDTHKPADIGHKALARSLSDLAAMGSEPEFCLVSLALPAQLSKTWLKSFYKGFLDLAERFQVSLAGGDLASFEKVAADVICCGRVPRGKALLRSAAKPGDRIYVTGELGGSALGLHTKNGAAWRRHLRPEPRIQAGIALRRLGVRCAMDVSDGLILDLHRLCVESKVSAELGPDLPIARNATRDHALYGGDDYELLFTASPKHKIPALLCGLSVTEIGRIKKDHPGRLSLSGTRVPLAGFD